MAANHMQLHIQKKIIDAASHHVDFFQQGAM
jgi:hypothetical protein